MSVYFMYHHQERHRVEPYADAFNVQGFDVRMAPVGWKVGSEEWWRHVHDEIEASSACIAFFSKLANTDENFLKRCDAAQDKGLLIPILLDDVQLPSRLVGQLQVAGPYVDRDVPTVLARIAHYLPRQERKVMCFISYSRADAGAAAKIEEQLSAAAIPTWRDVKGISAGAAWDNSIEQAILDSSHILALVSVNSVASQNVADEIGFARERKKIIVPLLLDHTPLPMRMHRAQAIDLRSNLSIGSLINEIRAYQRNDKKSVVAKTASSPQQGVKLSFIAGLLRMFRGR